MVADSNAFTEPELNQTRYLGEVISIKVTVESLETQWASGRTEAGKKTGSKGSVCSFSVTSTFLLY